MRKPVQALALVFLLLMLVNSSAPHQEPEIEANASVEAGSEDASGEVAGEGEAVGGSTGDAVGNISDQKGLYIDWSKDSSKLLPVCVVLGVLACACLLSCCFPGDANAVHPPPQHKWHQDTSSEDYREERRRRERRSHRVRHSSP